MYIQRIMYESHVPLLPELGLKISIKRQKG